MRRRCLFDLPEALKKRSCTKGRRNAHIESHPVQLSFMKSFLEMIFFEQHSDELKKNLLSSCFRIKVSFMNVFLSRFFPNNVRFLFVSIQKQFSFCHSR